MLLWLVSIFLILVFFSIIMFIIIKLIIKLIPINIHSIASLGNIKKLLLLLLKLRFHKLKIINIVILI